MQTSVLFNDVMLLLWDAHVEGDEVPKEAIAIAAYIKNHRVNAENAFEVLRIMWPNAKMQPRPIGEGVTSDSPSEVWYDVQFEDGSQVLLQSLAGQGSAVEVI